MSDDSDYIQATLLRHRQRQEAIRKLQSRPKHVIQQRRERVFWAVINIVRGFTAVVILIACMVAAWSISRS